MMLGVTAFIFGLDLREGAKQIEASKHEILKGKGEVDEAVGKIQSGIKQLNEASTQSILLQEKAQNAQRRAQQALDRFGDLSTEFDIRIKRLLEARGGGLSEAKAREISLTLLKDFLTEAKSLQDSEAIAAALRHLEGRAEEAEEEARKKITADMSDANAILNELFNLKLELPKLVIEEKSFKNAYWSPPNELHAPPSVKNFPDIVYHESAHPFIDAVANLKFEGQSGALCESFADSLASFVKQKKAGEHAHEAKWVIAPGAIGWLKDEPFSPNGPPLHSLEAPGTAYNDPVIGKDPQRDRFSQVYTGSDDLGGVRINAGIPSKAFYETAMKIGTDKAAKVWVDALRTKLRPDSTFIDAAKGTVEVAGELYGAGSREQKAVQAAWEKVEVLGRPSKS
jgi:Zn-dependent metalloprotease